MPYTNFSASGGSPSHRFKGNVLKRVPTAQTPVGKLITHQYTKFQYTAVEEYTVTYPVVGVVAPRLILGGDRHDQHLLALVLELLVARAFATILWLTSAKLARKHPTFALALVVVDFANQPQRSCTVILTCRARKLPAPLALPRVGARRAQPALLAHEIVRLVKRTSSRRLVQGLVGWVEATRADIALPFATPWPHA